MIRCIPVDGSEPFEVENDAALDRFTARDDHIILRAERIADIGSADEWTPRFSERTIACRIESWRERAERLEKELAALHSAALTAYGQTEALDRALDTIAKRCLSEHG